MIYERFGQAMAIYGASEKIGRRMRSRHKGSSSREETTAS